MFNPTEVKLLILRSDINHLELLFSSYGPEDLKKLCTTLLDHNKNSFLHLLVVHCNNEGIGAILRHLNKCFQHFDLDFTQECYHLGLLHNGQQKTPLTLVAEHKNPIGCSLLLAAMSSDLPIKLKLLRPLFPQWDWKEFFEAISVFDKEIAAAMFIDYCNQHRLIIEKERELPEVKNILARIFSTETIEEPMKELFFAICENNISEIQDIAKNYLYLFIFIDRFKSAYHGTVLHCLAEHADRDTWQEVLKLINPVNVNYCYKIESLLQVRNNEQHQPREVLALNHKDIFNCDLLILGLKLAPVILEELEVRPSHYITPDKHKKMGQNDFTIETSAEDNHAINKWLTEPDKTTTSPISKNPTLQTTLLFSAILLEDENYVSELCLIDPTLLAQKNDFDLTPLQLAQRLKLTNIVTRLAAAMEKHEVEFPVEKKETPKYLSEKVLDEFEASAPKTLINLEKIIALLNQSDLMDLSFSKEWVKRIKNTGKLILTIAKSKNISLVSTDPCEQVQLASVMILADEQREIEQRVPDLLVQFLNYKNRKVRIEALGVRTPSFLDNTLDYLSGTSFKKLNYFYLLLFCIAAYGELPVIELLLNFLEQNTDLLDDLMTTLRPYRNLLHISVRLNPNPAVALTLMHRIKSLNLNTFKVAQAYFAGEQEKISQLAVAIDDRDTPKIEALITKNPLLLFMEYGINNDSALMYAIFKGCDNNILNFILGMTLHVVPNYLSQTNKLGFNILHYAVLHLREIPIIRIKAALPLEHYLVLLSHQNQLGETPLHYVQKPEQVKTLFAGITTQNCFSLLQIKDIQGQTPSSNLLKMADQNDLLNALANKNIAQLKETIRSVGGYCIFATFPKGQNFAHLVAQTGDPEFMLFIAQLYRQELYAIFTQEDQSGQTPISYYLNNRPELKEKFFTAVYRDDHKSLLAIFKTQPWLLFTPYHVEDTCFGYVVKNGSADFIITCVQAMKDLLPVQLPRLLKLKDKGVTPLEQAALRNEPKIARGLLLIHPAPLGAFNALLKSEHKPVQKNLATPDWQRLKTFVYYFFDIQSYLLDSLGNNDPEVTNKISAFANLLKGLFQNPTVKGIKAYTNDDKIKVNGSVVFLGGHDDYQQLRDKVFDLLEEDNYLLLALFNNYWETIHTNALTISNPNLRVLFAKLRHETASVLQIREVKNTA